MGGSGGSEAVKSHVSTKIRYFFLKKKKNIKHINIKGSWKPFCHRHTATDCHRLSSP